MSTQRHFVAARMVSGLATILALILAGCSQHFQTTSGPIPDYRQPELMFLKPDPYRRMIVEIDAVEGCEADNRTQTMLHDFLARYCNKPEGIYIVHDRPIRRAEARTTPAVVLALKHMQGPQVSPAAGLSAYMYILLYDSRLNHGGSDEEAMSSYVPFSYPCGIFIDLAYWGPEVRTYMPRIVCHEAAHVLGLTKSSVHGDGAHCHNVNCLMFPCHSPTKARFEAGYNDQFDLCADCRRDLRLASAGATDPHLSFRGPALIRTQGTYRVVSLPDAIYWDFAPFKPFDWQDIRSRAVLVWSENEKSFSDRYAAYRGQVGPQEVDAFTQAVTESLHDPDPDVVKLARRLNRNLSTILTRAQTEAANSAGYHQTPPHLREAR